MISQLIRNTFVHFNLLSGSNLFPVQFILSPPELFSTRTGQAVTSDSRCYLLAWKTQWCFRAIKMLSDVNLLTLESITWLKAMAVDPGLCENKSRCDGRECPGSHRDSVAAFPLVWKWVKLEFIILSPNTSWYLSQLSVKVMGNFSSDLRARLNISAMLYLRICHSGCTKMPPVLPSLSPVHSTIHCFTASASCTISPSLISPHLLAD